MLKNVSWKQTTLSPRICIVYWFWSLCLIMGTLKYVILIRGWAVEVCLFLSQLSLHCSSSSQNQSHGVSRALHRADAQAGSAERGTRELFTELEEDRNGRSPPAASFRFEHGFEDQKTQWNDFTARRPSLVFTWGNWKRWAHTTRFLQLKRRRMAWNLLYCVY